MQLHWPIEDPAEFEQKEYEPETLVRYRIARDRIARQLRLFGLQVE